MIKQESYNFSEITNRVEAAHKLQDAGQNEQAKEVLLALAKDIIGENP